jgi:hypothetical protein
VISPELSELNPLPSTIGQVREGVTSSSSRYAAPAGPRRTRVTTELIAEVVGRYQHGESSRQVSEGAASLKSTVLNILKSEGIDVRAWGRRY